jgi:SH3-like domain-containing protein
MSATAFRLTRLCLLCAALAGAGAAWPAPAAADSGLPVPRFVTLGSDRVNVRAGPGTQYPVEWIFVRRAMPVEVVDEFDTWRRIRDREGAEGWVHQSLLSGRRGAVVLGDGPQPLRADPGPAAEPVARAEPGVIGRLLRCPPRETEGGGWCYVDLAGYRGWMPRDSLWGVYPFEEVR